MIALRFKQKKKIYVCKKSDKNVFLNKKENKKV